LSGPADPALAARARVLLAHAAFLVRPGRGGPAGPLVVTGPDGGGPKVSSRADRLVDLSDYRVGIQPATVAGGGRERAAAYRTTSPRRSCAGFAEHSPPWVSSMRPRPRSGRAGPRAEAAPSGGGIAWARWPRPAWPPPRATPPPPSARFAGRPTAGAASRWSVRPYALAWPGMPGRHRR
jgi:hypothetical protein